MSSIPTLSSRSPTRFAEAGPDVGVDPFAGPLTHGQINGATSGIDTQGRNSSWPYRQPAEHNMFLPASTSVYPYPMEIEMPSAPPAQVYDHRERVYLPTTNVPQAVRLNSPPRLRPRAPQPPLELDHTQRNNTPTESQLQRPNQRRPSHVGPSTATGDSNSRTPYNHSARRRRPRNLEEENP